MQLVRFYKTYQNPLGQLLNEFSKFNSTGGLSRHHYWRDGIQESHGFRGFLRIPYRTKFRRTKFSTDKIFCRTKFSTPSRNFDNFVRFCLNFYIEILDKIFDGQNFSSDKIFATKPKFRQLCPTNFAR